MIRLFAGMPILASSAESGSTSNRQVAFAGDLPATPDVGRAIAWSLAAFALVAVGAVILTVRPHLTFGTGFGEVLVLSLGYGVATLTTLVVSWSRVEPIWLLAPLAPPIVYIASICAVTGGGVSPFITLYAPLLAIAGWHLSLHQTLAAAALVVGTEIWRSLVIDGTGSTVQLALTLPFDVAVALVASFAASRLRAALTEIRRDQVRLDSALQALRDLESSQAPDLMGELRRAFAQVFEADAVAIELDAASPSMRGGAEQSREAGTVTVMVSGPSRTFGVVRLAPRLPLSPQELRLATLMADAAGRIAEADMGRAGDFE